MRNEPAHRPDVESGDTTAAEQSAAFGVEAVVEIAASLLAFAADGAFANVAEVVVVDKGPTAAVELVEASFTSWLTFVHFDGALFMACGGACSAELHLKGV